MCARGMQSFPTKTDWLVLASFQMTCIEVLLLYFGNMGKVGGLIERGSLKEIDQGEGLRTVNKSGK